jgi:A/G-specific adenine glycosylase
LLSLPELPAGAEPAAYAAERLGARLGAVCAAPILSHTFTHFRLHIRPLVCEAEPLAQASEPGRQWLDKAEQARAALPAPIRRILGVSAIP